MEIHAQYAFYQLKTTNQITVSLQIKMNDAHINRDEKIQQS